jgi:hypothetical protein
VGLEIDPDDLTAAGQGAKSGPEHLGRTEGAVKED